MLPYFKRSERYAGGETRFHGASGELGVSNLMNDHAYCNAWVQAGQQFGLPFNPDFNAETDYGVGAYQLSIRNGLRASASRSFLHPVLQRPNLTVVTGAHATRVLLQAGRATGVEWLQAGKPARRPAANEVILSAGTLQIAAVAAVVGHRPRGGAAQGRGEGRRSTIRRLAPTCRTTIRPGPSCA